MNIVSTILLAAKSAGVSGTLLLAICQHESGNFKHNYNAHDRGSASIGSCQIKRATAEMVGFTGTAKELMNPKINAKFAAKYLAYQQFYRKHPYGNDWVKLVASYNSGTYHPSKKVLGCPRNLKYIVLVKKKLPDNLKYKLNCGG